MRELEALALLICLHGAASRFVGDMRRDVDEDMRSNHTLGLSVVEDYGDSSEYSSYPSYNSSYMPVDDTYNPMGSSDSFDSAADAYSDMSLEGASPSDDDDFKYEGSSVPANVPVIVAGESHEELKMAVDENADEGSSMLEPVPKEISDQQRTQDASDTNMEDLPATGNPYIHVAIACGCIFGVLIAIAGIYWMINTSKEEEQRIDNLLDKSTEAAEKEQFLEADADESNDGAPTNEESTVESAKNPFASDLSTSATEEVRDD